MDKGGTAMKRWKKMMAFCFAFLMAFVMFGSSVEAANGPNEQDWSSAYIGLMMEVQILNSFITPINQ